MLGKSLRELFSLLFYVHLTFLVYVNISGVLCTCEILWTHINIQSHWFSSLHIWMYVYIHIYVDRYTYVNEHTYISFGDKPIHLFRSCTTYQHGSQENQAHILFYPFILIITLIRILFVYSVRKLLHIYHHNEYETTLPFLFPKTVFFYLRKRGTRTAAVSSQYPRGRGLCKNL